MSLRSAKFREERESVWAELEDILARVERRGVKSLDAGQLIALPKLYRATLSSLSVARATSLDQGVIAYLESLSSRAYYALYGTQIRLGERMARFVRRDWPAAARRLLPETIASGGLLLVGAIVAFILVASDPDWFYSFVPESLAGERDPSASEAALRKTLYDDGDADGLAVFAAYLFSHNSAVSILAFALGFAFAIPTAVLMLYNGMILGAFIAVFTRQDLGFEVGGWLIIHGATELFAIALAGAAGMRIGRAVAFPGGLSRRESASRAGAEAGLVMAGVVVMLLTAGLIEGFARQLITSDIIRYGFGISSFLLWCAYFYLPRAENP